MRQTLKSLFFSLCFILFCQSTFAAPNAELKCPPLEKVREIKFSITWYDHIGYDGWVFVKTLFTGLTPWNVYFYSDIFAPNPPAALTLGQRAFENISGELTAPTEPTGADKKCIYLPRDGQGNSVFAQPF